MLNIGSFNNPKTKVAFDSFEKLLLVTTQIYTSERSLTCHVLSILTTNQTRIVLMFHGDYYAIQDDSDILAKILGLEVDSLEA